MDARILAVSVLMLAVGCGAPVPRPTTIPDLPATPFELRFEDVRPGIVLAYRPDMPRYPVVGNAVLIFGTGSVILVDGGGSPAVVEQIVARIQRRTDDPVTHLVVSHWHSDHTIALDRYREHYPSISIVAHPFSRQRIADVLTKRVETFGERARGLIDDAEAKLAADRADDGSPLEAAERDYLTRMVADRAAIVADRDDASAGVPDTIVDDKLVLAPGGKAIEVHFLGKANSPGDLIVYLPEEKLLIGGDIVTHPIPFGYPKYPRELARSLRRLLDFDFDRLIPGHGPVLEGKSYARRQLELIERTNRRIEALVDEGLSLDEIRERMDFSADALAFTGGDPRLAYFFDEWFAGPVVERTYNDVTDQVR